MARIPSVSLSCGGKSMPVLGMGTATYPAPDAETVKKAVIEAIKTGYRHFDMSPIYKTEEGVGQAIEEALQVGLIKSREELFLASKLWCDSAERDLVVPAIKESLRKLGQEYFDLYMIHVPLKLKRGVHGKPIPKDALSPMDIKAVWEGMEECKTLGLAKAIGVSNFSCNKLEELLAIAKVPPAVNQVEVSPFYQQRKLTEFCKAKGIQITAYSPLGGAGTMWGHSQILESDALAQIAKAKGKTIAQIALRWVYQQGVNPLVKSFKKERMEENMGIFDWSLTEEESNQILQLPQRKAVLFAHIFGPHELTLQLDAEL